MALPICNTTTSPTAQGAGVTARYTPAADRVFETVELVEMILCEVSIKSLINVMRSCKSLYFVIKTSKAVLRDRFWLSQVTPPVEHSIDPLYNSAKILQDHLFKRHRGFAGPAQVKGTSSGFSLMMSNKCIWGGNKSQPFYSWFDGNSIEITVFYYGVSPEQAPWQRQYDFIAIDSTHPEELWRRIPLTNFAGGMRVEFRAHETRVTLRLNNHSTLGDLYVELSKAAVASVQRTEGINLIV